MPGEKLTDRELEDEQINLFGQDDYVPIEFNGNPSNALDRHIKEVIDDKLITIPVLHVENNKYLLGIDINEVHIVKNSVDRPEPVIVDADGDYVSLEDYLV